MKNTIALLLISANISFAQVSFNGTVNYIKQYSENLSSKNNIKYKFKLHEDHRYIVSLSNAMSVELVGEGYWSNMPPSTERFAPLM